ncbi:Prophage endopeptidase tail [Bacillus toyonensis]|uniref:phage tail protein n=2 Tax=Bacillus toyonensis TaxID=155322 RepID=UPI00088338EB|nr:phage tail protein [Bacillus toyonensis]SDK24391.1 Prophage endopeptidase tail [Bacillus toyonensis]
MLELVTVTDLSGNTEILTGFLNISRIRRVNGEKGISFLLYPTEENGHSFPLVQEENKVEFDGETYVIKSLVERNVGNTFYKKAECIHEFYVKLMNKQKYAIHNNSMTFRDAVDFVFEGTGYQTVIIDPFYAQDFQEFGKENRLALLKTILERYKAEMFIRGNVVSFKTKIGEDTDFQFRYNFNIKTFEREIDTKPLATYIRGYGKDGLERAYTSPNVHKFGLIEADSIDDERFTTIEGLDKALKENLQDTPIVRMTIDFIDLRKAGYPYNVPNEGDRVLLIYEPMDIDIETRLMEIEEVFNEKLEPIACRVTLANYKKDFGGTLFQTVQKVISGFVNEDGKIKYNALDEAVKRASEAIKDAQTELTFKNGILAVDPENPNNVVAFNSAGIGISRDGGKTFKEALTYEGLVASVGVVGQLEANNIRVGPGTFFEDGYDPLKVSDRLETLIDNVSKDNVISVIEKQYLNTEWNKIQNEYVSMIQIALGYWKAEEKIAERDMYIQRYNELKNFLTVLVDENNKAAILAPSNMKKDSIIDGELYKNRLKNYFESQNILNGLIVLKAKEIAETAQKTTENISKTLLDFVDDSKIDIMERRYIKEQLANIIGTVLPDTANTLPIVTALDSGGKGEFYSIRKQAINIGIPTSDANYVAVATQYTNLKLFLENLTPVDVWDTSIGNKDKVISINPTVWSDTWLKYYQAVDALSEVIQAKAKKNVDEQTSGGSNILKNTADFIANRLWGDNGQGGGVPDSSTLYNGKRTLRVPMPQGVKYLEPNIPLKRNTYYTYSTMAYGSAAGNGTTITPLHFWAHTAKDTAGQMVEIIKYDQSFLSKQWKRLYVTFLTPKDKDLYFSPYIFNGMASGTLNVIEMAFQEGSIVTGWTENPDEVREKIEKIQTDLRLTSPLPTNIALGADGITANTGKSDSFARLDYRGLYSKKGAVQIEREDGYNLIINGIANFDMNVSSHEPPFMSPGVNYSAYWYATRNTTWSNCNYFTLKHTGRYLVFALSLAIDPGSSAQVKITDVDGKDLWYTMHSKTIANDYYVNAMIDLGVPTGNMKYIYLKLASNSANHTAYARLLSAWQER